MGDDYLKKSVMSLLDGGKLCDFSLVSESGKTFKAHKPILAARSPIFQCSPRRKQQLREQA